MATWRYFDVVLDDSESEAGLVIGSSLLQPATTAPSPPPPAPKPEQGQPPAASPEEGMVTKVVVEETSEGDEQDSEEDGGDGFEHEYGYRYFEDYLLEEDEGVFMEEQDDDDEEDEFIPLPDKLRMSVLASRKAAAEPPHASGRDAEALAGPSDGSHLLVPGSREPLVAQEPSGQVFGGSRNSPVAPRDSAGACWRVLPPSPQASLAAPRPAAGPSKKPPLPRRQGLVRRAVGQPAAMPGPGGSRMPVLNCHKPSS